MDDIMTTYDPASEPDSSLRVRVTPAMAAEWLARYPYHGNRKKSQATIDRYAQAMRSGRWLMSTIEFYRAADTGLPCLGNGHRRLMAVAQSGTAVVFRLMMETLPNFAAIRAQYATIDDPNSARELGEVLAGTVLEPLGSQYAKRLRSATSLILDGFNVVTPSKKRMPPGCFPDQIELISDWLPEAEVYHPIIPNWKDPLAKGMVAAPGMAVALVTLRYDSRNAKDFWGRVAGDDGLARGCPEWAANRYLREQGADLGVSAAKRARHIAACWNAMKQGRTLVKTYGDPAYPIKLLGTPYKSG